MSDDSNSKNIIKKIDFTGVKPENLIANNDNDEIIHKKISSFDDQHDLTCKIKPLKKTASTPSKRNSMLLYHKNKSEYNCTDKFFTAAYSGDLKTLKAQLLNGINPNYKDQKGRTALHLAVTNGDYETAKLLLTNGSSPNSKDINGNSPMHLAVLSNQIQMVTLLLKNDASCKEEDNDGRTPLKMAKWRLKIIQDCSSYNSEQLKQEAKNIIEMIQIYLSKSGRTEKLIVLNHFITRLNIHDTKEDVDNDLSDLLKSINNLNLQ